MLYRKGCKSKRRIGGASFGQTNPLANRDAAVPNSRSLFAWGQESVFSIHGLTVRAAKEIKKLSSGLLMRRMVQQSGRVGRNAVLIIRKRDQCYGMRRKLGMKVGFGVPDCAGFALGFHDAHWCLPVVDM